MNKALTFPGGGHWKVAPGQITDDGELTLTLLKALLGAPDAEEASGALSGSGSFDLNRIAEAYVAWVASGPFDIGETLRMTIGGLEMSEEAQVMAVSTGVASALQEIARESAKNSQSNGSLMRIAPLAVFGHKLTQETLLEIAAQEVSLSHSHAVAQLSSQVYLLVLHHILNHCDQRLEAFHVAREWIVGVANNPSSSDSLKSSSRTVLGWMDAAAKVNPTSGNKGPKKGKAEEFGIPDKIGWCKVSLTLALRCLLGTFEDGEGNQTYESAIRWVLGGGGDTDTNAAIVGALVGAAVGFQQLPKAWVDAVLSSDSTLGNHPRPVKYSTADVLDLVSALLWVAPSPSSASADSILLVPIADDPSWSGALPEPIYLVRDVPLELGRGFPENRALGSEKRLSRRHITVCWDGDSVTLGVHGRNGCALALKPDSALSVVGAEQTRRLKVGEVLCLLPNGDFKLQVATETKPASFAIKVPPASSSAEDIGPPAAKRRKVDDSGDDADLVNLIQAVLPETPLQLATAALTEAGHNVDRAIELLLTESQRLAASLQDTMSSSISEKKNPEPANCPGADEASAERAELRRIISTLRRTIEVDGVTGDANTALLFAKLTAQVEAMDAERQHLHEEAKSQQALIALMRQEREEAIASLSDAKKRRIREEEEQRIYVPGEREALASDKFRSFTLLPTRQLSHDAASMHFRTAESQFYRLMGGGAGTRVTKVEYIVNPKLVKEFETRRLELAAEMPDWDSTRPIFVFHGTSVRVVGLSAVFHSDILYLASQYRHNCAHQLRYQEGGLHHRRRLLWSWTLLQRAAFSLHGLRSGLFKVFAMPEYAPQTLRFLPLTISIR